MTTRLIRTITGAALCASLSSVAQADMILGVYAGANAWNGSLSGDFNSANQASISADKTLNVGDDTPSTVYLALEHFVPLIPNVRLAMTDLNFEGEATLATDIIFEDSTFATGETVNSKFDFSHNDITLYYELLDNVVSLDLGVNVRLFDGELSLFTPGGANAKVNVDETVPMLYAAARADLPFTGLYVAAEGNLVSLGGSQMQDTIAKVGYEIAAGFGIEGGYRVFRLNLEDVNNVDSDLSIDGAYAAATFHF